VNINVVPSSFKLRHQRWGATWVFSGENSTEGIYWNLKNDGLPNSL